MARGQEYSELGEVMDSLARDRRVRGPYAVRTYMEQRLLEQGRDPDSKESPDKLATGQAVWKYFHGRSSVSERFVALFAELFELEEKERGILAWTFAYGFPAAAGDYGASSLTELTFASA